MHFLASRYIYLALGAALVLAGVAAALLFLGAATVGPAVGLAMSDSHVPEPFRPLLGRGIWLNGAPLRAEDLRGKVVLVNFWTYSCINSLRPLPYLKEWARKYRDRGLVVIGVHTPEFGFEKDVVNVRRAIGELGVTYPVVLDSDYGIWNSYGNNAWPAFYFVDAKGRLRHRTLGEGGYDRSERLIQTLLSEAHGRPIDDPVAEVAGTGAQAAPDWDDIGSGETYAGYAKAEGFASEGGVREDRVTAYRAPERLALNSWALTGSWNVGGEFAMVAQPQGSTTFRFHARDLNLVMAPPPDGTAVHFRVRIDGAEPGADHGADTDAQGLGRIDQPRMYQLVRQARPVVDRTFEIEFLDAGARVYVFTFG